MGQFSVEKPVALEWAPCGGQLGEQN